MTESVFHDIFSAVHTKGAIWDYVRVRQGRNLGTMASSKGIFRLLEMRGIVILPFLGTDGNPVTICQKLVDEARQFTNQEVDGMVCWLFAYPLIVPIFFIALARA